jgi:polyhydroxyalkanoate synthesis regulator phasin
MITTKDLLKFYKDGASLALSIMEDGHMTIEEARAFIDKTVDKWYKDYTEKDDLDEDEGEDIDIRIEVRGYEK